jgi:EAL domain-containing protein (putative c-di-GMP-specific phosphodiesterase class I)
MSSKTNNAPWLEFFPQQGGPVQKTVINSFPFSIGRNDATDLPINSTRVSREHAAIVRAGSTFRARDLDSTNGTFVNGQRIEEATLTDGDIIAIADVEFTFFTGNAQAARTTVTQVIGFREADNANLKTSDMIRSLRRLQETLLQGGEALRFHPIVELRTGKPIALEALPNRSTGQQTQTEIDRHVLTHHGHLATRLRESFRTSAAAQVAKRPGLRLFIPLDTTETDLRSATRTLDLATAILPDPALVVLDFPDTAVNDIPYFHELYAQVRARGAKLCYSDVAAGQAQVDVHRKLPANFLKLAKSMIRGVAHDSHRQSQIERIVRAAHEMGCEVIATNVEGDQDAQALDRLGCRYGMGHNLAAQPASSATKQKNASDRSPSKEPALAGAKP